MSQRVLFLAAAWGVLVLALGLRFFDLGQFSLWLDEVRAVDDSRSLSRALFRSYHPPASYVLLWAARSVLGDSELALRAPSALAGTLAVAASMLLAWRLGARALGTIVVGVVVATAPAAVGLSREARMYGLLMLACVLALIAIDAFLTTRTRRAAIVAGLAVSFAMTVHAYGALFCMPALVVATLAARQTRDDTGWRWVPLAPLVTLALLLLRIALRPRDHLEQPLSYAARHIADDNLTSPVTALGRLFWYRAWAFELESPYLVGGLVVVVIAACAVLFARNSALDRARRFALLASLACAVVALSLLPIKSATRLWSPALPLVVVIVALAIASLGKRWQRVTATLALLALFSTTTPFLRDVYRLELEPWRLACDRIAEKPGPVLVSARYMLDSFLRCAPDPRLVIAYPDPSRGLGAYEAVERARALASEIGSANVWVIASHTNRPSSSSVDGDGDRAGARALSSTHVRASVEELSPLLRTERHVLRAPTTGSPRP